MSESGHFKGEAAPEHKETEKQVSFVVTYDGKYNPRIAEVLKSRNDSELEFIDAYNMPEHPPVDLLLVNFFSNPDCEIRIRGFFEILKISLLLDLISPFPFVVIISP